MDKGCCRKRFCLLNVLVLLIVNVLIVQYLIGINITKNFLDVGAKYNFHRGVLNSSWINNSEANTEVILTDNLSQSRTQHEFLDMRISSSCPYLSAPNVSAASSGKWVAVGNERQLFVFSAFYVDEDNKIIITGMKARADLKATCQLWYLDGNGEMALDETHMTIQKQLPESHGRR